jgi:pimeloyl-ACP methyl ester carboxylesterase
MFIEINGARLFFETFGGHLDLREEKERAKPVLLVLHGGPGLDHMSLRKFFNRFVDECQVVYFDLRGHGRSRDLAGSDQATWNLAQWGDDVASFCNALGLLRPIVYGQSFGGMVAQSYAIRHPGHAAGLVFSSTSARMVLDDVLDAFERLGGMEARRVAFNHLTRNADDDLSLFLKICFPLYLQTANDGYFAPHTIVHTDVYDHFGRPGQEMWTMDFRDKLKNVVGPVLVIYGDKDPASPRQRAWEIYGALPRGADIAEIKDAGHGAHRDKPEVVEPILRKFIARCMAA